MAVATKTMSRKLQTYERVLRTKREDLLGHLADRREEVRAEQVPDDQYGIASRLLLEEQTIESLRREREMLGEIEAALERLEEGEFGVCEGCGEDIPQRRLNALPWARFCVPCAEQRQVHWNN